MLAGEGGQHGWASLILSIFVSVWLVRSSERAARIALLHVAEMMRPRLAEACRGRGP